MNMNQIRSQSKLRVLYIGDMGSAVNNLLGLSKLNYEIIVVNTSLTDLWDYVPGLEEMGLCYKVVNLYDHLKLKTPIKIKTMLARRILRPILLDFYKRIVVSRREELKFRDLFHSHQIDLIFAGTTDFSKPWNDVRKEMLRVADYKIHVFCAEPSLLMKSHDYVHFFKRFDTSDMVMGKLTKFLARFDACIVLYNGHPKRVRFTHSIPNRFIIGLVAGIPISLPRGLFPACEDIINQNGNGFTYKNVKELNIKLRNVAYMQTIKRKASDIAQSFIFDNQLKELDSFIRSFLP